MKRILLVTVLFVINFFEVAAQTYTPIEAESADPVNGVSGVSVESTSSASGGQNITSIDNGDWMDYSITVPVSGSYKIGLRVGTWQYGAQATFLKGTTELGSLNLPELWNMQGWATVYTTIHLTQGTQTVRIKSTGTKVWNLDLIEVSQTSITQIFARNWSAMYGVETEQSWTVNEIVAADIYMGDWMDYSVNIPVAGTYTVRFRIATPDQHAELKLKSSAGVDLATVTLVNTGGWNEWQSVSVQVPLQAGTQTLRVECTSTDKFNFHWLEFEAPAGTGTQINPPQVNASADQHITLPLNSVTLTGTASNSNGSTPTTGWTKVSGPTTGGGSITNPSALSTTVTNLMEGVYTFRLTASNQGGSSYSDVMITVHPPSSTSNGWSLSGNAATAGQFIGTTNAEPLLFKTNGVQQARLGTDGIFYARKIQVTQTGWADFVFDSTYKLRPLADVERFIKKNKHLPDVPSAKEVVTKGLNVGDNQAVLLQKIEELTLYVIELNKQLELQDQKIKSLQQKAKSKK